MEKDFPSSLFSCCSDNKSETRSSTDNLNLYKKIENITKLSYHYPINIIYNDKENKPECYTQMCFSNGRLKRTLPLLPWNLANSLTKGCDIYLDLKSKSYELENKAEIEYYYADCKSNRAKFYPDFFVRGKYYLKLYT
jgi:hypothetical protein